MQFTWNLLNLVEEYLDGMVLHFTRETHIFSDKRFKKRKGKLDQQQ